MLTKNHRWAALAIATTLLADLAAAQLNQSPPPPAPEYGLGPPRVDLKMAVVMVLLVTVFFILGFLSVYTRQCAQERSRARLDLGFEFGPGASESHARGLDRGVVETFPAFVYSAVKGLKIGKGSLECAVCLSEFEDSETLRLIPKCDHVFHRDCVDAWLASHSTCPVCRAHLVPEPDPEPQPEPEPGPRRVPRSWSTGIGSGRSGEGVVGRSRSAGESTERFTLRLPGEVRTRLVIGATAETLPRVGSRRKGFRKKDGSVYDRFDPDPDSRWVFSEGERSSAEVRGSDQC